MVSESTYHPKLQQLYVCLRQLVDDDLIRLVLMHTWGIGALVMGRVQIKTMSYHGNCLKRFSPDCSTRKGWWWFDPTNYVYAVLWNLLFEIAGSRKYAVKAVGLKEAMKFALKRFPTVECSLRFVLGRCYLDMANDLDYVTKAISDVVFWLRYITDYLWDHGHDLCSRDVCAGRLGDVLPRTLAKGLLYSRTMVTRSHECDRGTFDAWCRSANACFRVKYPGRSLEGML
jgi:hypothetical protein